MTEAEATWNIHKQISSQSTLGLINESAQSPLKEACWLDRSFVGASLYLRQLMGLRVAGVSTLQG
jgi:hypothetical protein